jgi:hypothetical protein
MTQILQMAVGPAGRGREGAHPEPAGAQVVQRLELPLGGGEPVEHGLG